jgi:hypothetical protein
MNEQAPTLAETVAGEYVSYLVSIGGVIELLVPDTMDKNPEPEAVGRAITENDRGTRSMGVVRFLRIIGLLDSSSSKDFDLDAFYQAVGLIVIELLNKSEKGENE